MKCCAQNPSLTCVPCAPYSMQAHTHASRGLLKLYLCLLREFESPTIIYNIHAPGIPHWRVVHLHISLYTLRLHVHTQHQHLINMRCGWLPCRFSWGIPHTGHHPMYCILYSSAVRRIHILLNQWKGISCG